MFPTARLKFLQQRKLGLLEANEVQRRLLAMECAVVQQRLESLDRTVVAVRRILPWCSLVLPIVRLWSFRHEGEGKAWFGKMTRMLPIARNFAEVWKRLGQLRD